MENLQYIFNLMISWMPLIGQIIYIILVCLFLNMLRIHGPEISSSKLTRLFVATMLGLLPFYLITILKSINLTPLTNLIFKSTVHAEIFDFLYNISFGVSCFLMIPILKIWVGKYPGSAGVLGYVLTTQCLIMYILIMFKAVLSLTYNGTVEISPLLFGCISIQVLLLPLICAVFYQIAFRIIIPKYYPYGLYFDVGYRTQLYIIRTLKNGVNMWDETKWTAMALGLTLIMCVNIYLYVNMEMVLNNIDLYKAIAGTLAERGPTGINTLDVITTYMSSFVTIIFKGHIINVKVETILKAIKFMSLFGYAVSHLMYWVYSFDENKKLYFWGFITLVCICLLSICLLLMIWYNLGAYGL